MRIERQIAFVILIIVTLVLGMYVLFPSSHNDMEESRFPVWKDDVLFENLIYKDEVPERFRKTLRLIGPLSNSSFPYVIGTETSGDVTIIGLGLKDVLVLENRDASKRYSKFYLYSEDFGLYEYPDRLNTTIEGPPLSHLMAADFVDVSGYRFDVKDARNLYHIFCITEINEVVISIGTTTP